MSNLQSPKIKSLEWGKVVVDWNSRQFVFKDVLLAPRACQEWDWSVSDTHHQPGIQIEDVKLLLEAGANYILLSTGFDNALRVAPETIKFLDKNRIPYEILNSSQVPVRYTNLVNARNHGIGLLLHSTC